MQVHSSHALDAHEIGSTTSQLKTGSNTCTNTLHKRMTGPFLSLYISKPKSCSEIAMASSCCSSAVSVVTCAQSRRVAALRPPPPPPPHTHTPPPSNANTSVLTPAFTFSNDATSSHCSTPPPLFPPSTRPSKSPSAHTLSATNPATNPLHPLPQHAFPCRRRLIFKKMPRSRSRERERERDRSRDRERRRSRRSPYLLPSQNLKPLTKLQPSRSRP
jgi:hypothetical protein